MQEVSIGVAKRRFYGKDVPGALHAHIDAPGKKHVHVKLHTPLKRSYGSATGGINPAALTFNEVEIWEAVERAGGAPYGRDILRDYLYLVQMVKHAGWFKEETATKREWTLPMADQVIVDIYENLTETTDTIVKLGYPDEELLYMKQQVEDCYMLQREEHNINTGAIFLSEYDTLPGSDRRMAFQALKIMEDHMGILLWHQTNEWNQLGDIIRQAGSEYKTFDPDNDEHVNDVDENDENYLPFTQTFVNDFHTKWHRRNPLSEYLLFVDSDHEDLYDRMQLDDMFAVWLRAIMLLYERRFEIGDYCIHKEDEIPPTENYVLMMENDSNFIEEYDAYFYDGNSDISYPGLCNCKIIEPFGVAFDNLGNDNWMFMDLIFSFNPKMNTFYGHNINEEQIETYFHNLHLSGEQRAELLRALQDYRRQSRRVYAPPRQ